MLHIVDDNIILKGTTSARIFKKNEKPKEFRPGDSLNFLLKS